MGTCCCAAEVSSFGIHPEIHRDNRDPWEEQGHLWMWGTGQQGIRVSGVNGGTVGHGAHWTRSSLLHPCKEDMAFQKRSPQT